MNNEPVAWTQVEIMNALTLGIPLYTHPVKELTDEEILQVHSQMMEDGKGQLPPYVDFARAILRKAQE